MRGVSAMNVSFLALGTFYCDRATGFVTPHAAAAVACATRRRPSDALTMAAEVQVGRTRRAKTHTDKRYAYCGTVCYVFAERVRLSS